MIISLDTETTGIDFSHGAKPFLVTTCNTDGVVRFWEFDVDPLTRQPHIHPDDTSNIQKLLDEAELIYLQNSQFDAKALATIGIQLPWNKVRDTLVAGHLLASNHKHDLTSMVMEYLGEDIESYELRAKEVVQACRAVVKREHPDWRIAREGDPNMPSVKDSSDRSEDKPWKNDLWLPRALSKQHEKVNKFRLSPDSEIPNDTWLTVTSQYANTDSASTLWLGLKMEELVKERGYWQHYLHRLQLMRVACETTSYGVTARGDYTRDTIETYERYVAEVEVELHSISREAGWDLELAQGAALNDNMRQFFYGSIQQRCPRCNYRKVVKHWNGEEPTLNPCPKCISRKRDPARYKLITSQQSNLNLPVIHSEKSGNASLDASAMSTYKSTLPEGPGLDFVRLLTDKRKRDTHITYMRSYERFWVPIPGAPNHFRIRPSINPFGTDHLRGASSNPNLQNVGKQEGRCEECNEDGKNPQGCGSCNFTGLSMLSARNCFGPAPGREWWDMDFQSIEDRLPAYESGEPALIELFEKPNEPPYWGSNHNLTCSLLWSEMYYAANTDPKIGQVGQPLHLIKDGFKKRYINEYKRAKNTNFAKNYGGGKRKVEMTAQVPGAYDMIDRGKPFLAALQQRILREAEKTGLVYTIPTRAINPKCGYPILASRTEDGGILSTTPFNYHISGTACECKNLAWVRCADQCAKWRSEGFDAHVSLEVHDSILFDFPKGKNKEENLPRVLILKGLMEQSGRDLIPPIPLPVSIDYHPNNWAVAE